MWSREFSPGVTMCDFGRVCMRMLVGVCVWWLDCSPGERTPLARRSLPATSFDQMELRRRHPCAQYPLRGELVVADAETPQRAAKVVQREPRVEQGAENHVARGAIETVEIQQLHTEVSGHRRRPQTLDLT